MIRIKTQQEWRSVMVHRLAASLFLGLKLESDDQANHRCDVPRCFNPAHLYIGDQGDNVRDAMSRGRHVMSYARGEIHPRARLTNEDVHEIRRLAIAGVHQQEIGRRYGIRQGHVSNIVTRRQWGHLA
jgi:hypothetical protein